MIKTLSAKAAAQLDKELMSTGAFSIDQLMELAGLAVAKAIYKEYPPASGGNSPQPKVLFLVGPGNNGGDGLVCARHLKLWNYAQPVLYYPKRPQNPLYTGLTKQLRDLGVEEVSDLKQVKSLLNSDGVRIIVDSLFGFSFLPPVREPFSELLTYICHHSETVAPIVSIDIPSGWHVDDGPLDIDIGASMLVSLTAPKPCARFFGAKPHYLGGRFVNDIIAEKYGIGDLIKLYKGDDLVVKLKN